MSSWISVLGPHGGAKGSLWVRLGSQALCCLAALATACTGSIEGTGTASEGGGPTSPPERPASGGALPGARAGADGGKCTEARLAPQLWRLDDRLYANAVRDLLGLSVAPPIRTSDGGSEVIGTHASLRVTGNDAFAYQETAEAVVAGLDDAAVRHLLPCAPEEGAACARRFATAFASRAFRRPAAEPEVDSLMAVFTVGAEEGFMQGARLVVQTVLQAPSFLYRKRTGNPSEGALTAHEVAGEIAFLLLGSLPDAPLSAAANDGTLLRPPVLASQVERLLGLPEAREHLADVMLDWLRARRIMEIDKDQDVFAAFDDRMKTMLLAELEGFLLRWLERDGGSLTKLLTSTETVLNEPLASLYGLGHSFTGSGDAFVLAQLPADQRSGLLTNAALLAILAQASTTSIINRGLFVWMDLLCEPEPPMPPDGLLQGREAEVANLSERALATYRARDPLCANCHGAFDSFGIVFERFDPVGRYRTSYGDGTAIDTVVTPPRGALAGVRIADPVELGRRLAESEGYSRCLATLMTSYTFGRNETAGQACAASLAHDQAGGTRATLSGVLRSLLTAEAFRMTAPGAKP